MWFSVPLSTSTAVVACRGARIAILTTLDHAIVSIPSYTDSGNLAFAFGAQKTVENLFGSISLAVDQPLRVGDFVKVEDFVGTVEEIGIRSTRFRTLDRTLIAIPNSQVADSKIENFAVRDRIRLVATFGVQYDTSLEQVRYIIDEFKRYLLESDRMDISLSPVWR